MKLLTPEEVAEQLAISRSTVLRLIADNALPAICLRRGKRKAVYRVREEILLKWILVKEKQNANRTERRSPVHAATDVNADRPHTRAVTDHAPVDSTPVNGEALD